MRKYWWVNHKQTVAQEIDGGYLWSPKRMKNGAKSHFYDNMRLASPGDFVLSFANGEVRFLGKVDDFAISSAKPNTFGTIGEYWSDEGWRLPIIWQTLVHPVRPKRFINELGSLLPEKYSPMQPETGNGNQAAYLAEISYAVFEKVLTKSGVDLELAMSSLELASLFGDPAEQLDEAIERQLQTSIALTQTEKESVILARRGQGQFRTNVKTIEKSCRLTGITNAYYLIASHIKPWRSCVSSNERLDGNNGLLLTPHVDFLFDRGLISFEDNGRIILSNHLDQQDLHRLGINETTMMPPRAFLTAQVQYLNYHQTNVFLG